MKPKEFRRLQVPTTLVPKELPHSVTCGQCGKTFALDWLKLRNMDSRITPHAGGGQWVRAGVPFDCPECGWRYEHPIAPIKPKFTYNFYGDDAHRGFESDGNAVYVYAFLGDNPGREEALRSRLEAIKRFARPGVAPDSWVLHVKDFFNRKARRRRPDFADWSDEHVAAVLDKGQEVLCDRPASLNVLCSVAIAGRPAGQSRKDFKAFMQHETFLYLFVDTVRNAAQAAMLPRFILESEQRDGWARDAYRALWKTPYFPVISGAMDIPEPKFRAKAPNELTELADVVAFVVARHCKRHVDGQAVDLDPAGFGEIAWYGFAPNGGPRYAKQAGFPWRAFHGVPAPTQVYSASRDQNPD